MNNKVCLRHDIKPTPQQIEEAKKRVTIYAPLWVKHALTILQRKLIGQKFQVFRTDRPNALYTEFEISEDKTKPISLVQLLMMARNEVSNTTGKIRKDLYSEELPPEVILGLKDLARQCVTIGLTKTENYGGFPKGRAKIEQEALVYVCDLAPLQFQNPENSGRFVVSRAVSKVGDLDDFIYRRVVGKPKLSFEEVQKLARKGDPRFVRVDDKLQETYFDTWAFQRFVTADVILTLTALIQYAYENKNKCDNGICFKFLKYGTGLVGAQYRNILELYLLPAVIEGIATALQEDHGRKIKSLEFPGYVEPEPKSEIGKGLEKLKKDFGLTYKFSQDDPLKGSETGFVTATTNCANPHAGLGNEMGYGSMDGAIAENLKSKGVEFMPALNKRMKEVFI